MRNEEGFWILDVGCWMLDAGCWTGYWIPDERFQNCKTAKLQNCKTAKLQNF
jgi:hypothetical protein